MAQDDRAGAAAGDPVQAEVVDDVDVELVEETSPAGGAVAPAGAPPRGARGVAGDGPVRLGVAALHPLLVTVPIGAFVCALAFDLASIWVEAYTYARGAMWLVIIGLVSAVIAAVFGAIDRSRRVRPGSAEGGLATRHVLLNVGALLAFGVGLVLRRMDLDDFIVDGSPIGAVILSVVGVLFLLGSALAGGTLAATLGRNESSPA